ncbi:MAG: hypothetical protein MHMPM18_000612 [Marteilia pararefringens]
MNSKFLLISSLLVSFGSSQCDLSNNSRIIPKDLNKKKIDSPNSDLYCPSTLYEGLMEELRRFFDRFVDNLNPVNIFKSICEYFLKKSSNNNTFDENNSKSQQNQNSREFQDSKNNKNKAEKKDIHQMSRSYFCIITDEMQHFRNEVDDRIETVKYHTITRKYGKSESITINTEKDKKKDEEKRDRNDDFLNFFFTHILQKQLEFKNCNRSKKCHQQAVEKASEFTKKILISFQILLSFFIHQPDDRIGNNFDRLYFEILRNEFQKLIISDEDNERDNAPSKSQSLSRFVSSSEESKIYRRLNDLLKISPQSSKCYYEICEALLKFEGSEIGASDGANCRILLNLCNLNRRISKRSLSARFWIALIFPLVVISIFSCSLLYLNCCPSIDCCHVCCCFCVRKKQMQQ